MEGSENKAKKSKRNRTLFSVAMLAVCVVVAIAVINGRRSQADESLKSREQLGWYSVLVGEGEYSEDVVPTVFTAIGRRTLTDYYTTSSAGKYWSVYSYLADDPEGDVAAYTQKLIADEGFEQSDAVTAYVWLERDYANGLTTVVTIYPNETGYEVWVGSQQGRRT